VSLACFAQRSGDPLVLKLNPRRNPEEALIAAQTKALEFWSPTGVTVRPIDARDAGLTVLLERILPGDALDDTDLGWEEQLVLIARLVARLHDAGAPPTSIPMLADYAVLWGDHIDDPEIARELEALIATADREALLHGDLHPGNALRGAEGWTVIDPTAFRGDPNADIWALICPQAPADGRFREHATAYAAAAGLDAERAIAWARVRAAAECSGWLDRAAVKRMR
jgi:streptomycin 6-kinase